MICDGLTTPIALVSEKWLRAFELRRISPYSSSGPGGLDQRKDRFPHFRHLPASAGDASFGQRAQQLSAPALSKVISERQAAPGVVVHNMSAIPPEGVERKNDAELAQRLARAPRQIQTPGVGTIDNVDIMVTRNQRQPPA